MCSEISEVAAITEGWADAAAPTIRGIPTAAIVGVYNVIYSLPQDCRIPMIYDSDGWTKPQVVRALILGSIWTNGKINLFPQMDQFPDGGGCEFFKAGYSAGDYQTLINESMKPYEFILKWTEHFDKMPDNVRAKAIWVACEALEWLKNPYQVLKHLEKQRDEKIGDDRKIKGISAEHVPNADSFLDNAVEVA
jgi:hypothetical protein